MKHIGGMHSFGKNGKIVAVKYFMYWSITMAFLCNFWGVLLYLAGADPIGSFVLSFSMMLIVYPTCSSEIHIFKSSYTGTIISREEVRKKLKNSLCFSIVFQLVSFWSYGGCQPLRLYINICK